MNILAFFAHPDDETMLAGGTLAFLAQKGALVHYLSATRGEGGEVGDPPVCEVSELGAFRESELVCAVKALGGKSLTFLSHQDPRIGPDDELFSFSDDLTLLAGQVAATIRQFDVQTVITHGSDGEYGHPAHITCHQAALAAVLSFGEADRPALYSFAADFDDHPYPRLANKNDRADLVLDISPVLEQKIAAAYCHRSQHALFVRRRSEKAGVMLEVADVVLKKESLKRVLPKMRVPLNEDPLFSIFES